MERRVGNQLADADVQGLISPGCSLHLTVDLPKGHGGKSLGDDAAHKKRERKKLTSMLDTCQVQ